MARQLWPDENPIGRRFTVWRDEKFPREVVGVVGDAKPSLDKEAGHQMYALCRINLGQSLCGGAYSR